MRGAAKKLKVKNMMIVNVVKSFLQLPCNFVGKKNCENSWGRCESLDFCFHMGKF